MSGPGLATTKGLSGGRLPTALAAGAALLLVSCGGIEFDVELQSETVVESGTLIEQFFPMVFDQFVEIDLTETREFENNDVNRERVRSLRMSSFVLEVVDPEDGDLSFLRSLELFVQAEDEPEVRVAYSGKGAFATGVSRVELELEDVELQPYAAAEHFNITSEVSASRRPPVDTTISAQVVFRVLAGL
ncbi:MAG: hypothetical protein ACOCVR_00550 [Myxococcota bacterium]